MSCQQRRPPFASAAKRASLTRKATLHADQRRTDPHYRQLAVRGYGTTLSYDRMAYHLNVDPVHVKWAVDRLVELGLVGVERGSGSRANVYLPALPKRIAKSMLTAAADDAPPF